VWCVDNSEFVCIHRARATSSQLEDLLHAPHCGWIPSISTARAQAWCRFAQVIHMLMHSRSAALLAGWQPAADHLARACGTRRARRTRQPSVDEIAQEGTEAPVEGQGPQPGQGPRARTRSRPRTFAVVRFRRLRRAVAVPATTFLPSRIRQGPCMYEMQRPCRPRRTGASASAAQGPSSSHFRFSAIHKGIHGKRPVIRIRRRLCTGLLTPCPQAPMCEPVNNPVPSPWLATVHRPGR
jgi:hypothetical protein